MAMLKCASPATLASERVAGMGMPIGGGINADMRNGRDDLLVDWPSPVITQIITSSSPPRRIDTDL